MKIPKTATERQKTFRLSRLAAGLKEIRNLWSHPEDEPRIRDYAALCTRNDNIRKLDNSHHET